jgi:hypothetical protein
LEDRAGDHDLSELHSTRRDEKGRTVLCNLDTPKLPGGIAQSPSNLAWVGQRLDPLRVEPDLEPGRNLLPRLLRCGEPLVRLGPPQLEAVPRAVDELLHLDAARSKSNLDVYAHIGAEDIGIALKEATVHDRAEIPKALRREGRYDVTKEVPTLPDIGRKGFLRGAWVETVYGVSSARVSPA